MINKSHPEDKVVEQPRVIRPPRPNLKQPKPHQNYHSADFTSHNKIMKNSFNVETQFNNGESNRSHKSENFENENMREIEPQSPLMRHKTEYHSKKSGGKMSVSFKENTSQKKIRGSVRSENSNFSQMDDFKTSPLFQKMATKIRTQAKRIVEIEGKLIESEKREFKGKGISLEDNNLGSGRSIKGAIKEEINMLKKKMNYFLKKTKFLNKKSTSLKKQSKKQKAMFSKNLQ